MYRDDNAPVGNPLDRGWYGAITMVMTGSLLVFLRRDIGIRLLVLPRYAIVGGALIWLANFESPFDERLAYFTAAFMTLALVHYCRHRWRIACGVPEWHSYSTGRSILFSSIPFLPPAIVRCFIEPALCGALGWWLAGRLGTFYVGWWIVYSAVLLFATENAIRVARRERLLDLGDAFVESEHFSRMAENFAGAQQGGSAPWWGVFSWRVRAALDIWRKRQEAKERRRREQEQHQGEEQQRWRDAASGKMTVEQALEVLELKPGATEQEIKAAYNRLIQRVHPDAGGSTFFAKQLNAARDVLLRPQGRRKP